MNIVALLAAYNEADIIGQVVADLIAQGLSVYLIDHHSTDGTAGAAAPWLGRGLLKIEQFPEESGFPDEAASVFAWESLLERKEQLAASLDADWFLHTDADELRESPFSGLTLAEAIAEVDRLGYNAIDFAVFNFAPTDDDFTPGTDLRAHFRHYEPAQLFDRLQIKCWKKQPSVDLRGSGGHEARFPGREVFPVRFLDRHYPLRTQAQAERKVFVERKPRFVDEERRRGWHVQYDQLRPGHSFLRHPDQLRLFDAAEARRALFHDHRGAEEERERAAGLARELEERVRDLATRERQVDEWQGEALKARRLLDERQRELEEAVAGMGRAGEERDAERRARLAADAELRRKTEEHAQKAAEARAGLEQARAELARERERMQTLRAELERSQAQAEAARAELEALTAALRGAEVRIDEIYASRTWRWTAPGRLLWRVLRR